jgi:hypothetical protein
MKNLYMVHDITADAVIGPIIQEVSDPPAIRAFYDALRAEGSLLAQHPSDFNLIYLGVIGDLGDIFPNTPPKIVATGNGWLEMQKGLTNG